VRHAWRYVAIGIAVYLLILVVTFPVDRLTNAVAHQIDGLSIQAVTGSLFSGQAGRLSYQGNDIGPVRWRFSPAGLLRGRLDYRLQLQHPDHQGHASVGMTPGGAIVGHDVELQLQPDRLLSAFSPMAVSSTGQLTLQLDSLVLRDNRAQEVSGILDWKAAALLAPLQLPLGDIQCVIENSGNDLVARIVRGGSLGASGDITLTPDGRYTIRVLLAPGPEVDADTRGLLGAMIPSRPDGKFLINTTGRI
jgi:general secretion pathway protein N